jgi:zinc protease
MKASIKKIRTIYGITEYILSNGLRVLYKRDATLPIAAVCVTYHVGSRNEAPGHTGATHILEHLLFKDSENFKAADGRGITNYLEWMGALMNATTYLDRTNYFELLPKERVAEALEMEADRMRGSLFNDVDLASEMTVVRNEFERSRNNPFEALEEEVLATAFTMHPYRIPTIGIKEDIEGSTAAKLREFYDRFYWPNNATLAIFGDVSPDEVESVALKYFGAIPHSPHEIPTMNTIEPIQQKSRTCEIRKPTGVSALQLAYKSPAAMNPDFLAVYVFATILAGGFSSRLQKKIVDAGHAAELHMSLHPFYDACVASFTAVIAKKTTPKRVLALIKKEIAAAIKDGITKAELNRARERLLSEIAEEHDGIFGEIRAVSESIAAGDWTLSYRFERELTKLKPSDVNRIAKKYFIPNGETAGTLIDTMSGVSATAQ